jgi:hypothetical protein
MRLSSCILAVIVPAVLFTSSFSQAQITLGQKDTFSGSLLGWSQGPNAPGPALASGGPGGADDQYMQITATGFGPGGRITVFNREQWTGNYNAAGVARIELDLLGPTSNAQNLMIRIAFKSGTDLFSPGYVSTTPFVLPNDGQWRHAVFDLTAQSMTAVGGPAPFEQFMNSPVEMRILHSSSPVLNGDFINAVLGIDNVLASPIPEPTSVLAAAAAAAGLAWPLLRRRRRSTAGSRGSSHLVPR